METNDTEPYLLTMISAYLMERESKTMEEILQQYRIACYTTMESHGL